MNNSDPGIDPRPETGETDRRTIVRSGSILSVITLASRVLGLVREIVKGAFLGTSPLSNAFSAAFVIPNLLRRLFAEGSIAVAFIPTFKGYLIDGDREKTKEFLSAIFTVLAFFVTITVLTGIAVTPLIVKMFGTDPVETTLLTRIMFPYLGVISIAALFQGILNSENIFTPSGLTPILFNLSVILSTMFLAPRMENPARAMAIGVLAGGTLQAVFQLPFVLKRGVRFPLMGLRRALRNPGVRTVFKLIAPTVIGMAAYQFNDLVSSALASNAGDGISRVCSTRSGCRNWYWGFSRSR